MSTPRRLSPRVATSMPARPARRVKPGRGVRLSGAASLAQRTAQAHAALRDAVVGSYRSLGRGEAEAGRLPIGALYRALAGCIGPRRAYDVIMQLLTEQHRAAQQQLEAWAESMRTHAKLDKEAAERARTTLQHSHQLTLRRLQRAAAALRSQVQAALSLRAAQAQVLLRAHAVQPLRLGPSLAGPLEPWQDGMQPLTLRLPPAVPVHWAVPRPTDPRDLA